MNKAHEIYNGKLTLCELDDFQDTIGDTKPYVVSLCRYPIRNYDGKIHHTYLNIGISKFSLWLDAVKTVEKLLQDGENVVLHCVYGRDRTGAIAYAVLRRANYGYNKTLDTIQKMRPRRAMEWSYLMVDRYEFHEALVNEIEMECWYELR